MQQPDTIIAELEEAVRSGNAERRVHTLRQVTNLFLCDGERLSEDQIKVFDGVLCLLVAKVEARARAELGQNLAHLDYAPVEVIQRLAGTTKSPLPEPCSPTRRGSRQIPSST
jgi:uncharacterized protein (DUF2336 family)